MNAVAPLPEVRTPPNHVESERCVLGCMLRGREAALTALDALQPEDFYDPANRAIFTAMQRISRSGGEIDFVTLDAELGRAGKLDAVGGPQYLVELSRSVPSALNVSSYIAIVRNKSALRRVIGVSNGLLQAASAEPEDVASLVASAERQLDAIPLARPGEGLQPITQPLLDTYTRLEELQKTGVTIHGVPTGYTDLDDLLTGLHKGELILIAGRPAMGKTSIGMNIIENASIREGKIAAIFSLEMPADQLALRMLCTEGRVNMQNARRGQLEERDWDALSLALERIGSAPIWVDATPAATVSDVRRKAKRLQAEKGLDVILIDYLSLMSGEGRFGSRQEEVSSISRALKRMAIDLDVPVVVLQQLSRAPMSRANHRPILSDIRESGAIEQDADVVMFIHREGYYDPDSPDRNVAELIVAKQRNGSLGTITLDWYGSFTYFRDRNSNPRPATNPTPPPPDPDEYA